MTGLAACCACPAIGQATAPSPAMNSRRFTESPRRRWPAASQKQAAAGRQAPKRSPVEAGEGKGEDCHGWRCSWIRRPWATRSCWRPYTPYWNSQRLLGGLDDENEKDDRGRAEIAWHRAGDHKRSRRQNRREVLCHASSSGDHDDSVDLHVNFRRDLGKYTMKLSCFGMQNRDNPYETKIAS